MSTTCEDREEFELNFFGGMINMIAIKDLEQLVKLREPLEILCQAPSDYRSMVEMYLSLYPIHGRESG